jgi:hypothetical protein
LFGASILVQTVTETRIADKYGNEWQYHSRSDRHSKVACWGVAFDLLLHSALLRRHAAEGKVVLGVNQKLVDYSTKREKALDLVVARAVDGHRGQVTFASLAASYGIALTVEQAAELVALPTLYSGTINDHAVLVALEAKATMTAHIKALPRLYDELNSSHMCVHGASRQALAIGLSLVNAATEFISTDMNKHDLTKLPPNVSEHRQPRWAEAVIKKCDEIPRRSSNRDNGFDGFGVVVVDGRNDGGKWRLVAGPPAPAPGTTFAYESMIHRMANEYDTTFAHI